MASSATACTLGAGAAFTAKYLGTSHVGIAFFGDGGANLGSFHEILNLAAIWKLPVVFVCENNLYATELSFLKATAGQSVAARAAGYAMPGVEIDGQDVLAVYEAAGEAIARARAGDGPSLIECRTYRYVGHHEGDPGTGYRTQEEIEEWKKRDPILLFGQHLLRDGNRNPRRAGSSWTTKREASSRMRSSFPPRARGPLPTRRQPSSLRRPYREDKGANHARDTLY